MAKLNIYPIGDNVVLRRVEAEEKTRGGILLPDTAKERPKEGVIVAVGRGKLLKKGRLKEPEVKVGDRVLFSSYAGTEVKAKGEELLILSESDILAVLGES